jgi:hypothetical protein
MLIPGLCSHRGPALLSYGFRPFFLFVGAAALVIWIVLPDSMGAGSALILRGSCKSSE